MKDEKGFTIPELLSVLIVTGIFVGLIMTFAFQYWRYGSLLEADMDTLVTRLNASDTLRDQLSASSGLVKQNSIPDDYPLSPDPADTTGKYWEPIHAIPQTITVGDTGTTPLLYYTRFSFDSSNQMLMNGTQPYEDEFVLYIHNPTKELRLRRVINPATPSNRLQTTCPPESATAACPADKIIASDLESVATRYFSRTGNVIDHTSVYDSVNNTYIGPDFPVVEVVEIKLNLTQKPFLQKTDAIKNSTIIRVALRNK